MATGPDARDCHRLLLRLAGRLPDDTLWRLRDWLGTDGAGGRAAVAATLPRALLRNRIGITDTERDLLVRAVGRWGASRRLIDAVLPVHVDECPAFEFRAGPTVPDVVALTVLAVVRGLPGVRELRQAARFDARSERRIVLVLGAEQPWTLTGTLQRLLRAHGDRSPHVEVLPDEYDVPRYHQAAILGSAVLWTAPADVTTGSAPALIWS